MMLRLARLTCLAAALVFTGAVSAQEVLNIAAVVNDEVISMYDLRARARLIMVSAGMPDTVDTRRRIEPQVLRSLIDEKLQMQEAKRLNLSVAPEELKEAFGQIEAQNGMAKGQLTGQLARMGIDEGTLTQQIRSTIAWNKIVRRQIRSQIQVGNEEVDETIQRLEANRGKPRSLVAEIFLAVDSVDQEDSVRSAATRLVEQLKGGAPFEAMAKQFSQSASAQQNGDLGWIAPGELPDELDKAVQQLQPGQMSDPIRSIAGYHVLLVRDRRVQELPGAGDATVTLRYIYMKLPPGIGSAEAKTAMDLANQVRDTVTDCADMTRMRKEVDSSAFPLPEKVKLGELSPSLRSTIEQSEVGKASAPIEIGGGLLVLMVCEREKPAAVDRARVEEAILNQRADIQMRRYMRDLRKAAFVDIRA
jgi:peptidyl-prolyl cis-trans isomerase SurA